jgi:2-C-methyl-D-erythritol 2,4-cyclodiphosphate synthase
MAIGIGFDLHALEEGGPLRLGGVDIPHTHHAVGHSDADVVLHALVDALLGAAGKGDIGERFPDSDPANKGRDSREFVREVWSELRAAVRIENVDVIVLLEKPKLGAQKGRIRAAMAELLGIPSDRLNVKAKTMEGFGPVGEGRAVMAQVAVQLAEGKA